MTSNLLKDQLRCHRQGVHPSTTSHHKIRIAPICVSCIQTMRLKRSLWLWVPLQLSLNSTVAFLYEKAKHEVHLHLMQPISVSSSRNQRQSAFGPLATGRTGRTGRSDFEKDRFSNESQNLASSEIRKERWSQVGSFKEPSLETQLSYARNGHTVLRSILDRQLLLRKVRPSLLDHAQKKELEAWKQKVEVALGSGAPRSCKTVAQCRHHFERHFGSKDVSIPFLQYFNNWRVLHDVEILAKSELLARTAACLMNVQTVRLYQDSLFWKRAGDGPTPWHVDARMAPFDTTNMITFWIPLQDLPSHEDSALVFCSASHCDFALPYWHPPPNEEDSESEWNRLEQRYGPDAIVDYLPLQAGDATVHSGWTLHCADANTSGKGRDRLALAITYVDGSAPVRHGAVEAASKNSGRGDNEDAWSYRDWVGEVEPQKRKFSHELVPIVWPTRKSKPPSKKTLKRKKA